jgi:hypothetical protein
MWFDMWSHNLLDLDFATQDEEYGKSRSRMSSCTAFSIPTKIVPHWMVAMVSEAVDHPQLNQSCQQFLQIMTTPLICFLC